MYICISDSWLANIISSSDDPEAAEAAAAPDVQEECLAVLIDESHLLTTTGLCQQNQINKFSGNSGRAETRRIRWSAKFGKERGEEEEEDPKVTEKAITNFSFLFSSTESEATEATVLITLTHPIDFLSESKEEGAGGGHLIRPICLVENVSESLPDSNRKCSSSNSATISCPCSDDQSSSRVVSGQIGNAFYLFGLKQNNGFCKDGQENYNTVTSAGLRELLARSQNPFVQSSTHREEGGFVFPGTKTTTLDCPEIRKVCEDDGEELRSTHDCRVVDCSNQECPLQCPVTAVDQGCPNAEGLTVKMVNPNEVCNHQVVNDSGLPTRGEGPSSTSPSGTLPEQLLFKKVEEKEEEGEVEKGDEEENRGRKGEIQFPGSPSLLQSSEASLLSPTTTAATTASEKDDDATTSVSPPSSSLTPSPLTISDPEKEKEDEERKNERGTSSIVLPNSANAAAADADQTRLHGLPIMTAGDKEQGEEEEEEKVVAIDEVEEKKDGNNRRSCKEGKECEEEEEEEGQGSEVECSNDDSNLCSHNCHPGFQFEKEVGKCVLVVARTELEEKGLEQDGGGKLSDSFS